MRVAMSARQTRLGPRPEQGRTVRLRSTKRRLRVCDEDVDSDTTSSTGDVREAVTNNGALDHYHGVATVSYTHLTLPTKA